MLVEGEAGVGKSRLVDEFLRTVVAGGATVLRGRGYDATAAVPFAPIVEALRGALDAPGLAGHRCRMADRSRQAAARAAAALPRSGRARADRPIRPMPGGCFEGVAQLLGSLAAERPLVISVDDLQWCDEDSCKLIQFLARRLERAPILWLGTTTLGELERDAPAARLCRTLRAKAGRRDHRALRSVARRSVWRLVREMGHVSTPTGARRFARRIHRITGGNPFYIIELIKTMFAQGLLAADEESGEWTAAPSALEGGKEFPLSRTVHDVIAERVDRLPEELGEVLITVAVAGGPGCRPEVLSHVHGISRLHAAACATRWRSAACWSKAAGVYRCLHPVIAHVVRDGLTPTRRREVHRALAASLEAGHARRPTRGPSREKSRATPSRAATGSWPTARRCSPARARSSASPSPRRSPGSTSPRRSRTTDAETRGSRSPDGGVDGDGGLERGAGAAGRSACRSPGRSSARIWTCRYGADSRSRD